MNLIALSGSLRSGSSNTALLRAAVALAPAGVTLDIRTLKGIPLYDGDMEDASGPPGAVLALGKAIVAADGLLIATPEYNNSIPGPLKNAIDWLSRIDIDDQPVFAGKHVAVIGASSGGFGTILSQAAWLPVFRFLQCRCWFGDRFLLSKGDTAFAADGSLADAATSQRLAAFVAGFAACIRG